MKERSFLCACSRWSRAAVWTGLLALVAAMLASCGVQRQTNMFRDPDYEKVYREGRKAGQPVIRLKSARDTLAYYRYRLQPGDELRVRILNLPPELAEGAFDLEADARYMVNIDGYVHVPLAGRFYVQGKVTDEVRRRLYEVYAAYFRDPNVEVAVSNLKVFIYGEANKEGVVLLPTERTHLIEALALAGGVPQSAKSHKVKIIRGRLDDPQVIWVDMNRIAALRDEELYMRSGDIIYLETRTLPLIFREATPYLLFINLLTVIPSVILIARTL